MQMKGWSYVDKNWPPLSSMEQQWELGSMPLIPDSGLTRLRTALVTSPYVLVGVWNMLL